MILKHPTDPQLFATFNIEGTGIGVWGVVWPEDINSEDAPEYIAALALWASNDRFFLVKLDDGEEGSVLAELIWKDPEPVLVREFKVAPLPSEDESTGLFGRFKFQGQSRTRSR